MAVQETRLMLRRWKAGDLNARDALIQRLHPELSQIAAARLRREAGSSLSTHDLVNEVVVRLIQSERLDLKDRAHLLALASRMMRHILIDHARTRGAARRRDIQIELSGQASAPRVDLLSLDAALVRLKAVDESLTELVSMRYFGGMTTADIAAVVGMSEPTVKRRWQVARAWLADALDPAA